LPGFAAIRSRVAFVVHAVKKASVLMLRGFRAARE